MIVRRTIVLAALAATSSAAGAQRLGGAGAGDVSFIRVFLALLVCLIGAVLAIFLIRHRLGGKAPPFLPRLAAGQGRIRLIESRRISPQAEVSLIECDGSQFLLLVGAGGSLLLDRISAPMRARDE